MEESQRVIAISVNLHRDPDIVTAVLIYGNLERPSLKADTVIGTNGPFVVFADDIVEILSHPGDKC